jgi:Na+-driven multidrug efflux pump
MWTTRIGFGIFLAKFMNMGMFGVWVAMILDWVVRSVFFLARYRGNKWESKKEQEENNVADEAAYDTV